MFIYNYPEIFTLSRVMQLRKMGLMKVKCLLLVNFTTAKHLLLNQTTRKLPVMCVERSFKVETENIICLAIKCFILEKSPLLVHIVPIELIKKAILKYMYLQDILIISLIKYKL